MKYLLDVNVLLAWGWADHAEHRRAALWIAGMKIQPKAMLLTSAIPELGFVRVSVQRTGCQLSVAAAAETLAGMLGSLGAQHEFLPDDLSSTKKWPAWCDQASRTTDAHLLKLACSHGAQLVTLDTGIPGALLLRGGE
ncbi:MAG: TA system VapC family ribonuclease toxin [Verrucomicrobiota bacterium]